MAVNYADWTNASNRMRRIYANKIPKQFNLEAPTFAKIPELKAGLAQATEDGIYIKMKYGQNWAGQGVLGKSPATLRESRFPLYREGRVRPVFYQHFMQLDMPGLAESGKTLEGGMDLMAEMMDDATQVCMQELEYDIWGNGSGKLAETSAASTASTTVTLDSTQSTQNLRQGMVIDIVSAAGAEEVAGDPNNPSSAPVGLIVDVDRANATITLNAAVTCTSGAGVYIYNTKDAVIDGIQKLVDNGDVSSTTMNIDVTAAGNSTFKSRIIDNDSQAISLNFIERALNLLRNEIGEGARSKVRIISNIGQQSEMFLLMASQRRYEASNITAGPPSAGVKYGSEQAWDTPIFAPYKQLYVGVWDSLFKHTVQSLGFSEWPSGGWQRTAGVAAVENFLWAGYATGILDRRLWVKGTGLTDSVVN
jgi:hypothetical protein